MQKALAILALVSATTAAPLAALCEWRCAQDPSGARPAMVASEPACHHPAPVSEEVIGSPVHRPLLANDERCGDHELLPALTESRRSSMDAPSPAFFATPTAVAPLDPVRFAALPSVPAQDTSPPPASISILRI
jgi:hypothetical protein